MAINTNLKHQANLSLQDRLALRITNFVGSMWCAYFFAGLALISLPQAISGGVSTLIAWIAQTFLQLVLLSIIMNGERLDAKHTELRAENDFQVNLKSEHEIEAVQRKLDALITHHRITVPPEYAQAATADQELS